MKLNLFKLRFWRERRDVCLVTHPYSRAIFCLRSNGHDGEHQANANAILPNDDGSDFSMTVHPDSIAWSD